MGISATETKAADAFIHELWLDVTHEKEPNIFIITKSWPWRLRGWSTNSNARAGKKFLRQIRKFSSERRDPKADQPAEKN